MCKVRRKIREYANLLKGRNRNGALPVHGGKQISGKQTERTELQDHSEGKGKCRADKIHRYGTGRDRLPPGVKKGIVRSGRPETGGD